MRTPDEAKTEIRNRIANYLRLELPEIEPYRHRAAEIVTENLWSDLVGRWYSSLLAAGKERTAVFERLERDWPEAAARLSFSLLEPCNWSRSDKWGDEARWLIEEHLGPAAQQSPDGQEAVHFCPDTGQQWLADHPSRTEVDVGPMRIRIVHERPSWWQGAGT